MAQLIRNLPITGLNLLGVGGQPVVDTYRQLRSVVEQRFGPDHAALFARPVRDAATGPIDWYVPDGMPRGEPRQLAELAPEAQDGVRRLLAERLAAIRTHAAELRASSRGAGDLRLAERLEKATEYPGDRFVYVIGDRPVLVCWGARSEEPTRAGTALVRERGTARPAPEAMTAQEALAPTPPPAPPITPPVAPPVVVPPAVIAAAPVARAPFPWATLLSVLLLLLFLAGITRTLIPACSFAWTAGWCEPAVAAAATVGEDAEEARLRRELEGIRRSLASRSCDAPRPRAAAPPPPPTKLDKEITDAGGKVGEINILLKWSGSPDLDLSVKCPNGDVISYGRRQACGGELDVDMNFRDKRSDDPRENILFPEGAAAKGRYDVRVRNSTSASGTVSFEVIVRVRGRERAVTGTVASGESDKPVTTFEVD